MIDNNNNTCYRICRHKILRQEETKVATANEIGSTGLVTKAEAKAFLAICKAVLETIREAGRNGAPAGHIFAALQTQGCTAAQFHRLMQMLEEAWAVRQQHLTYFAV